MSKVETKMAKKIRKEQRRFSCTRCGCLIIKSQPGKQKGKCPQCHRFISDPRKLN